MAVSGRLTGWHRAAGKGNLQLYYNGTLVGTITATNLGLPLAGTLALDATTTITAGTGLTVTTGNHVNAAGDHRVTAGNVRLGVVSVFATTEPTSGYVMKAGTAAAGAITTSGGIMTDGVTIQKIIADGTVSDIEA
jgi:hypothetical protein